MSNHHMKKHFPIEAFKHKVIMDPNIAHENWKIIEHAIHQIYNHNANAVACEVIYRHAYNMVLQNFGEKLYSGLVATMTSHLKEMATSIEGTQEQIKTRLSNTLLDLICRERVGEDVNGELIRNITKMLMDLGSSVYEQEFETPFLQVSAEFYRAESQKLLESCDCGDYLKTVERCLDEEMDRVCEYLDPSTEKKITDVVEKEMIANYTLRLIHMENSGLLNMLRDDKYEDLCRMYNLFCRVSDGFYKIFEVMILHVRKSFKELITQLERSDDPSEFVQRLLDEQDKYEKIINLAFNNDKLFQYALYCSFEVFTDF
ncbi:cullin 3-like protein [Trifolium pratense]|uniref:Cullin 3-like protein n=1 Tax=Trifolium pratense TaxID=57577 RepID=A0A2K3N832_TRIPR|nr:cullin 3-like protein [Trifolium pratense]